MNRPRETTEDGATIFRVGSAKAGFVGPSYRLTVPASLAREIGPERRFALELTEEGILYRFVDGDAPERPARPSWLAE